MARLTLAPESRGQFAAVTRVRWALLVHSLRTVRGRVELASRVVVALVFAVAGAGGAAGLGAGAWFFATRGKLEYLGLLLWPVFACWLLFPLLTTAFAQDPDSSHLLRFPLTYRFYFLIRILYGSLDPATALPAMWLFGILVGLTIAEPTLFPWIVFVLLVFAVANIFLVRMIFAWLERWLAQRRTREILGLLFLVVMISFQFIGPMAERLGHKQQVLRRIQQFSSLQRPLPPALAASAIRGALRGEVGGSLASLAWLSIYGFAFLWFLHVRMRAQYRGEDLSEAVRRGSRKESRARAGWNVLGLPGPIAAVFEKEFRYLFRSGPMIFNLVMPIFLLLIFRLGGPSGEGKTDGLLMRAPNFAFPFGVAYSLLILTNVVYNIFGGDSGGVQMFFVAPVRFRQVVVGKNLAHVAVLSLEMALIWFMVRLIYQPPSASMTLATLAGMFFLVPLDFSAGNLLSVYSPTKIEYGNFRRQRGSRTTILASFAVRIVLVGAAAFVIVISRSYGHLWLAVPVFLALGVLSLVIYVRNLDRVDRLAMARRETIMLEVSKV